MTNRQVLESWVEQKQPSAYPKSLCGSFFHMGKTLYFEKTFQPVAQILATDKGEKVFFLSEEYFSQTVRRKKHLLANEEFSKFKLTYFTNVPCFVVPFFRYRGGHLVYTGFYLYELLDRTIGPANKEIEKTFDLVPASTKGDWTQERTVSFWSEDLLQTVHKNLSFRLAKYFDFTRIHWLEKEQNRIGFLRGNGVVFYIGYNNRKFELTAEAENTAGQIWISRNWPRVLNEVKKVYSID